MKKVMISYMKLLQKAENYLAQKCWVGIIYSGLHQYSNVVEFDYDDDYTKCRAAALKNLTAIELFCDITENSNGEQFHMEHPNGRVVQHDSFRFKCTIKKVTFEIGKPKPTITEVEFKGYHRDLRLSREDTLHNVEVI